MSRRTERLASIIQQELMSVIQHELDDPRLTGFPSITRVKVSEDLSIADVFVTVMGTQGAQNAALDALKHSAGLMRSRLTRAISIRQAPFIKFHLDEDLRKELELMNLLEKVAAENREIEAKRLAAAAAEAAQIAQPQPTPGEVPPAAEPSDKTGAI